MKEKPFQKMHQQLLFLKYTIYQKLDWGIVRTYKKKEKKGEIVDISTAKYVF